MNVVVYCRLVKQMTLAGRVLVLLLFVDFTTTIFHLAVFITHSCIYILPLMKYIVVFQNYGCFLCLCITLMLSHDRIYLSTPSDLMDGCVST